MRNKIIYLSLLISFLFPAIALSAEWAKKYGVGLPKAIERTQDGGYIVVGSSQNNMLAFKVDSDGNLEWAKTFEGNYTSEIFAVKQVPSDGGYIVVGRDGLIIWILKLDSSGSIEWQHTYKKDYFSFAFDMQEAFDGGYVMVGYTNPLADGDQDILLIKISSNGTVEWAKTYGKANDDVAYSIQKTSDNGYIIVGDTSPFGDKDIFLLKISANGTVEWSKTYGSSTAIERAFAVKQTKDNGYIVAGYRYDETTSKVLLLKVNSNGTLSWAKTYQTSASTGYGYGFAVDQTADGGYIIRIIEK